MFVWNCPKCKTQNATALEKCMSIDCDYHPNYYEARCIHGFGYDMACDDCRRSGFRFVGVNDGTEAEREQCTGAIDCDHCREVFENTESPGPDQPYLPQEMIDDQLADEGSLDGPGFRCERLKSKTTSEEAWRAIHNPHKDSNAEFDKVYNDTQLPSYRLFRWVCPCGASLQSMEELEGVD